MYDIIEIIYCGKDCRTTCNFRKNSNFHFKYTYVLQLKNTGFPLFHSILIRHTFGIHNAQIMSKY